jgi:TatA/E family protein of Tat protein translocase
LNLGLPEILVILIFAILIVGPDKLPKLGTTVGKAVRQFRDAQDKVNDTLKKEGLDPNTIEETINNPFLAMSKKDKERERQEAEASAKSGGASRDSSSVPVASKVKFVDSGSSKGVSQTGASDVAGVTAAVSSAGSAGAGELNPTETSGAGGDGNPTSAPSTSSGTKVIRLSDRESFTQRKVRLQEQRDFARSADDQPGAVEDSSAESAEHPDEPAEPAEDSSAESAEHPDEPAAPAEDSGESAETAEHSDESAVGASDENHSVETGANSGANSDETSFGAVRDSAGGPLAVESNGEGGE